ncbi:MAG: MBL fold metallo-hydrolase [Accumulibacter sp.]|uniref:MBL fold metallo-hydrolase n=1 Tax=Accumulibacter sp. TaxID=2053492 RepID=UPI003314BAD2
MTYFRQIVDARSSSFAYLLADLDKREAVLIDPVATHPGLYLAMLDELQVRLTHLLLTHAHEPLTPAAQALRRPTGARLAAGAQSGVADADLWLKEGERIVFGDEVLRVWQTPGHTRGCVSYLWRDRVFSGDSLLLGGTARTPDVDPGMLFDSLTRRLLTLSDETLVYPAHDLAGRRVTCIGEARENNPQLTGITRDEFIQRQTHALPLLHEEPR